MNVDIKPILDQVAKQFAEETVLPAMREWMAGFGDDETPLVYEGIYVVVNGTPTDTTNDEMTLWVYIDSTVPGASAGSWVSSPAPKMFVQSANPLEDPFGIEGI